MRQHLRLLDSRGDVVLTASSRELDPTAEFWISGTPAGWYGGYSMRGENPERLGHGSFPTSRTRSPRSIEVRVKVHLDSWAAANALKRELSAVLGDGEQGLLWFEEAGTPELCAHVERSGEILFARVNPSTFSFSIPLTAPDPSLYGPWRESTLQPIGTGVGLDFPLFAGQGQVLTFGTAIDTTEYLWNDGNADSWPRFTVTADAPGGFAVGLAGRRVTYPWATWADIPVTVDMAGSLTVGGVDQSHMLGERGWAPIGPHSIEIPTFELLQGGTGFCTAQHRDTYI